MPKVFEEANLSGELRLSGRKLKDFPKTAAKYNLSDTVIAGKKVHSIYSAGNNFFHVHMPHRARRVLRANTFITHVHICLCIRVKKT